MTLGKPNRKIVIDTITHTTLLYEGRDKLGDKRKKTPNENRKMPLYNWWARRDSDPRPSASEADTLSS